MITQATTVKPAEIKTCSTCPNFNDFNEPNGRGWCQLFDHYVRSCHEETQTCSNSLTASPKKNLDIFANYSEAELEALREEAFPTKIVWVDSDGYPMEEEVETVENNRFVTYPN